MNSPVFTCYQSQMMASPAPPYFFARHFLRCKLTNWTPERGHPTHIRPRAKPKNCREPIYMWWGWRTWIAVVSMLTLSHIDCFTRHPSPPPLPLPLPLSGSCSAHHQTWSHTKYSTDGFFSGTWSGAQASLMAIKEKINQLHKDTWQQFT